MESTKLYKDTIELMFDVKKHHYTVNGQTVDGVTSILGIIAKPALIYWSANKASEYIDKFLEVGKSLDEIEKKQLVEGCKSAHKTLKDDAANAGTLMHEWIHNYIENPEIELPTNEMLRKSAENFLEWVKVNDVKFKWSERKVYSKQYNFAGTLDFSATIKGKNVIGDIKTSSGIWDEYWLQLAAYRQAVQEEFPEIKIDHCAIIRLGKDGQFEVKELNNFQENIKAFVGALELYRWQKQMKYQQYITQ